MEFALSSLPLPARIRSNAPMSDDELMQFSQDNRPLRMEREPNGEILVMTPAGFGTSRLNQRIGRFLDEWAETDGRGVVTDSNGGYKLPNGSMRAPDVGWVSMDKVRMLDKKQEEGFAPFAPDFVIELRSPSDRLPDIHSKMNEWIANGVEVGWLIDPKERCVTIYQKGNSPAVFQNPTSVKGSGCVEGFELMMERIWGSSSR